jgi:hypothetical protein
MRMIETDLDGATVAAIERHYKRAKERHPYFCDMIESPAPTNRDKKAQNDQLEWTRLIIKTDARRGSLRFGDLLECEVRESYEALYNGDKAQAVEELYDAIAVCLRAIDVIEGRQPLGKPQTISGNDAEK